MNLTLSFIKVRRMCKSAVKAKENLYLIPSQPNNSSKQRGYMYQATGQKLYWSTMPSHDLGS
jgi:hypothetical protein